MEEEAPSRRSVAELAGRFKASSCPHAGSQTEKPVRRRPPRPLQLPKTTGEDQEPPGVTSPLPVKAKRNSALIEKLQANLCLSPTALLPSPKSPGFRLLPPTFTPPPGPASPTGPPPGPTSPTGPPSPFTEEEAPTSFEAPPTLEEGSILSNSNIKGRARHSVRRRPPSRRHRTSSSGDDFNGSTEGGDVSLGATTPPQDKITTTEEEGGDVSLGSTTPPQDKTTTTEEEGGDVSLGSTTPPQDKTTTREEEGGDVSQGATTPPQDKTTTREEEGGDVSLGSTTPPQDKTTTREEEGGDVSQGATSPPQDKTTTREEERGDVSLETAGQS